MTRPPASSAPWIALVSGTVIGSLAPQPWSDLILGLVVLPALALTVSSARSLSGSVGWRLLAIGSVMIGFAPVLTEAHRAFDPGALTLTAGDAVLLGGYLFFIGGIRRVLTARTVAVQLGPVLESLLITLWIGFFVLAWAGPQLLAEKSGPELLASVVYVPLTLGMVFVLLQLVLGSAARSAPVWLVASTAGLSVVSELSFLAAAAGYDGARRLGVAAATLGLVALSAAIRHPAAATLETPTPGREELSSRRTTALVASLAAMMAAFVAVPRPPAYLAVLLAAIVVVTLADVVRTLIERERAISIERQLRRAVGEIMRAHEPDEVVLLGARAIDQLLADKHTTHVDFLARSDGAEWLSVPGAVAVALSPQERAALDAVVASHRTLRTEEATGLPAARYRTRLIVPLSTYRDGGHVLLADASPVLTTQEIAQVEQVVATVERALEARDLQEERHQRRADRRFRALVQDSGDVVALIDAETLSVTMVSPSMQRILGYSEAEFLRGNPSRLVHPGDRAAVEDLLANAVVRPQSAAIDIRVRHADGHYHWFSTIVRDLTNDPEIGSLVINLTDLHRRKMAELSLAASEQRYRTMVLSSKDVFAQLEPDLTISYISPNAEQLLNFPPQDLVASKISHLLTEESTEELLRFIDDARGSLRNDAIELELRTPGRGSRIGEVTLTTREGDGGAIDGYTISIRDVTEQRRLEQNLRSQALYDRLTGLANRSTLHFELQQRLQGLRAGEYVGIIHLDINDFKTVNESVGYEAGDDLLVEVATRLRSSLRSTDVLARIGGNEFAIALVTESEAEVEAFAQRLVRVFDEPFEVTGRFQRLAVSIGVHVTGDRRIVARSLLDAASLALGAARASSQDQVRVFEPSLRDSATERFELGADLGSAIARDQLSVVYQPIVEIATRKVRGVEALLRWTHPQRGPVSPGVFIPLAEKSGLVIELGRWVMARACRQLRTWHETVPGAERLTMSVNVSALQLERPGEANTLAETVVASGVEPHRVTAELTESTLIEDATWIRSQLEILRGLGMRVAVDDFGTGAAGLSYLRDVPFDAVKIDKSYVDALSRSDEATSLVRGVIALAHSLGAETVAEGIENPEEFELLQSLGCELGQGFYLARPMDPAKLEEWFALGRSGAVPALIAEPDRD